MSKATLVEQDARALKFIKEGVDLIFGAVKRTLGPEARTTLMYRTYNRGPRNVDDGFYTAEAIVPKNPFVKLAAEFFKEATMRTNRKVGDGTSATTTIAGTLFNNIFAKLQPKSEGYGNKSGSVGAMYLKKAILSEAKIVKEQVRAVSTPVTTLEQVEKIAAVSLGEENEISKVVANMAYEVGTDGFIDVVEGYKGEVETELVKGMRFAAKICAKVFVNRPERYEMVVEDSAVFITNHHIDNDLLARFVIEKLGETKLIIISPSFSDQVLVNMARSRENGTYIWPVKAPSLRTEQMEDIAIYCGAKLYDKNKGHKLQHVDPKDTGYVRKLTVKDVETREDAVLLGGKGEKKEQVAQMKEVEVTEGGKKVKRMQTDYVDTSAVQERIKVLRGQLEETKDPAFQKLMERRIASMASAGGVIRVGAPTDAESLTLKLKIEDVVNACRASLRSGYVRGGGLCLKDIAEKLPEDSLLKGALLSPYQTIQANAGGELEIGEDIIDPTDAVYYAVEHATSVVASLITVGTMVAEEPELETGEGEMEMAKAVNKFVYFSAKEKNILSENERIMMLDAMGGLNADEYGYINND